MARSVAVRGPRSLTARLIATAVLLVALTALAIGIATTVAMGTYLQARLDEDVRAVLSRSYGGPPSALGADRRGSDDDVARTRRGGRAADQGLGLGTVTAFTPTTPDGGALLGLDDDGNVVSQELADADLERLAAVPADGEVHDVRLTGHGDYRVAAVDVGSRTTVAGLPLDDVNRTLQRLVALDAVAGLLAVSGAAALGLIVVRRQLAPLREVAGTAHRVAELPLGEGEIELAERVPERLTDEGTEVGQVGAALNTLLAHVEASLAERQRSEQRVRRFVADASHELRTPLATIQGYAELARRHPEDDEAVLTALSKVETESGRMAALVGDLLMLARLDSGRSLERRPVDLTMLLIEAVSDARVLAPDHRWRLDLPDEAAEVPGDALALHQVATNLFTNARKYTPEGTTVTVAAVATTNSVIVTVHDDGPGFPEELVDTAFERFARGDAARTRTVGGQEAGVGLGLSLVRAIVEAHNGSASLTSSPGDTTITVVLPRQAD